MISLRTEPNYPTVYPRRQEPIDPVAQRTVRPTREIVELLREACPAWRFEQTTGGGHMAPLTRPDLINPVVSAFLEGP